MFLILLANNMFVIVQLCNHMGTKKRGQTHKVRLHNPYDCPYVVRILNVLSWALPKPTSFFPERTHVRQNTNKFAFALT